MSIYASKLRIFLFPKDLDYCDYCFFSNITLVIFLLLKKGKRETFQIRKMKKQNNLKQNHSFSRWDRFVILVQKIIVGPFPEELQYWADPWWELSKPSASHLRPKISLIS